MKRKGGFWTVDTFVMVLLGFCLVLAVLLSIARPVYLLPAGLGFAAVILIMMLMRNRLRTSLRGIIGGGKIRLEAQANGIYSLGVPVVVLSGKDIVWYNPYFLQEVADGRETGILPINKLVPGLDLKAASAPQGQGVEAAGKRYTAYSSKIEAESPLFFVILIENTTLKNQAEEYLASRPSVLYFKVDTYDEILKELKESERAVIMSTIDLALEQYIAKANGFIRRVDSSRYIAVAEERHVEKMVKARFEILDTVRKNEDEGPPVTLSIGVGRKGDTLKACEEMAMQALDMALGRGGDQASVKTAEGYEFYGGVSRSVEKRNKVKSRIIATAIRELMAEYDRVLIMGHRNADMDSLGAATGMLRFARICKKPAAIVIDKQTALAGSLIQHLEENGYKKDLLSPNEALPLADENTILIVVDTHMKHLLQSIPIYENCGAIVVIDHHRRMVGHIDNAVIFYHEPYASSASELVSELLQYAGGTKEDKPTPTEAEALLAGIMLDTRTFSLHVGVRTFEAAAYLRRMGAETAEVKQLFSSTKDAYLYRSHLVAEAEIYRGCALVVSDQIPAEYEVVVPQAANDLLTLEGVKASFVAVKQGEEVNISARSMGEINVQVIMEKMGGGGHLTMAGTQIKGIGLEQAEAQIKAAIDEFFQEGKNKQFH